MKVFYSWQSDSPRAIGKDFIREALDTAVAGLEVNEADRPVIDQDTQDVLGSPVIAETIFKKIREASVVVADVTLTGKTHDGKKHLTNSNVALELGYALGVHDDEVLLKVMNTYYGGKKHLPFDFAHRRWPVHFELAPEPTAAERTRVLHELAGELREILQKYVDANRPPPEPFEPTPATLNRASYWKAGEALVGADDRTPVDKLPLLRYEFDQPLIYLRIWPRDKIAKLPPQVLHDPSQSSIEPLCGTLQGWSNYRNRFGQMSWSFDHDHRLAASTQVFHSGEIWGVNQWLLAQRPGLPNLVALGQFGQALQQSLRFYVRAARNHFGYPAQIHVQFGLINVKGFRLGLPSGAITDAEHQIYDDVTVSALIDMDAAGGVERVLREIFVAVYEAAGLVPP